MIRANHFKPHRRKRKRKKEINDTFSFLPKDQTPWSWVAFPCEASPHWADRGCQSWCLEEEDGKVLLGPAVQMATAECPSPTPLGPPILPSGHGPEASWQTSKGKMESIIDLLPASYLDRHIKCNFLFFQYIIITLFRYLIDSFLVNE